MDNKISRSLQKGKAINLETAFLETSIPKKDFKFNPGDLPAPGGGGMVIGDTVSPFTKFNSRLPFRDSRLPFPRLPYSRLNPLIIVN